jgi:hypothetical protein
MLEVVAVAVQLWVAWVEAVTAAALVASAEAALQILEAAEAELTLIQVRVLQCQAVLAAPE